MDLHPFVLNSLLKFVQNQTYLKEVQKKVKTWIANGAEEAWLVDPIDRKTYLLNLDGQKNSKGI